MKKKNIYELDGLEFHSIKELSEYCGVHEKTITARIRRGMSVKDACKKKDFRCTYYSYENRDISLCCICKEEEKSYELVNNRLKYGYSLNDALNKPKKISKQGKSIVVNGILYNSIAMACRKLNLGEKENTIRSRLRAGKSPDEAFEIRNHNEV